MNDVTNGSTPNQAQASRPGRLYPYSYRCPGRDREETTDELNELLREYGGRRRWLLDIRYDPDADDKYYPEYRGKWFRRDRPNQYRHARGLGFVSESDHTLVRPEPAIQKMVEMLAAGDSFVIVSDQWKHVRLVENMARDQARQSGLELENPYRFQPGDLCYWPKYDLEVVLHHRYHDPYVFTTMILDKAKRDVYTGNYAEITELEQRESETYACSKCHRGETTTKYREEAQAKQCQHCYWLEYDV